MSLLSVVGNPGRLGQWLWVLEQSGAESCRHQGGLFCATFCFGPIPQSRVGGRQERDG